MLLVTAGRFMRIGDEVTGTLKVPQPARRRRGVTVIEAVLYIVIALALIVGGLVFFEQASFQSRTASVVRLYSALMAEARMVAREGGSISPEHAANFEELLYMRGSIPPENWDATQPVGQRLRLPFPGMYAWMGYTVAPNGMVNIGLQQFKMPVALCTRLLAATRASTVFTNGALMGVFQDDTLGPAIHHSYFIFPNLSMKESGLHCRNSDQNKNGMVQTLLFIRTFD
ncbi:MAG: hypothetical protein IOC92_10635 [Rhodobacter sp.]|nr:hypothetical protein [Rhodobacter sp.]MCA3460899.1 hypothetical protein [Rhodobacter sp.]MCA3463922.1 hypothetical protein [Rhodobacter sp.]MCA3467839.1 hypothetical protein [Rhodobacter sp.]MCA3471408.1 hypothetical protein [Rhodobacter sp.]